jgi:DNA polymerase-3 subunit gamma/tau
VSESLVNRIRPRRFSEMIGSEKLIRQVRRIYKASGPPKAWMLSGPTGVGKTTIAKIMAVSLQCRHQKEFGEPCHNCYKHRHSFDITTLNVKQRKVEDLEAIIDGAYYAPKPGSRRRVYVFDEAHMYTEHSQNALLKLLEFCPETTNSFVCTTRPDKILPTIQSRCTILAVPSLELEGIKQLIKRGLKVCHSDRSSSDLAEKLLENRITSPRLILQSVLKYIDPETTADEASKVTLVSDIDTYTICRTVIKGDWEAASKILAEAKDEDNTLVRKSVSGYLHSILLGDGNFGSRQDVIAKAIIQLNQIGDDMPATSAILYKVCKYFQRENR